MSAHQAIAEAYPAVPQRDPDLLQNAQDEGVEVERVVDGELVKQEHGTESVYLLS